ncbi:cell division protein SepF [Candidatus Woesearchaeota archaeon]|nr:cell division protein SepF [Candidatus Woesearchaeota archaeon]
MESAVKSIKKVEGLKMADFFSNVKAKITGLMGGSEPEGIEQGGEQEYVELDTASSERKGKVTVRPFVMENFQDIKTIVDSLRDGSTIAVINIRPLKDKDIIELKRAISKLKKTTDAISGDLAGFGDDYIIATPSFAQIYRAKMGATNVQAEEMQQAAAGGGSQEETF